jgi:putative ABC transport system permease protein
VRAAVLTSSPWTRAPLLLLRKPSVFVAIVGAVAVLAIAAASGVLFLSTIGTASLQAQAADDCPEYSLPALSAEVPGAKLNAAVSAGTSGISASGLPTPYAVGVGSASVENGLLVHLLDYPGALDHVQRVSGGGPGAWVPDTFATKLGLRAGGTIHTDGGTPIRVAGIYRDLAPSPFRLAHLPRFFCTWKAQIVPNAGSDRAVVETPVNYQYAPLLISDEATVANASSGDVLLSWYSPVSHAAVSLDGFDAALRRADTAAATVSSAIGVRVSVDGHLAAKAAIAHRSQDGVSGSVVPVDVAGVLVALLLVGGAGVFWATHRSREVRLLVTRGVGPVPLGVKAALETLPPALLGLAGGYGAAVALVRSVGPSAVLGPGAPVQGLLVALGAVLTGLVVIGFIGALSGRDRIIGARRGTLRHVPWELALLGVAVWLGLRIRADGGVSVDHTVVRVSPLLIIFPILGSAALLLLIGRVTAWSLPSVGRSAHRAGIAAFFALRRLAGSPAVVVGLIVGTALPCCLLTYGSTVTHGVSQEITAKTNANLGADHVLLVYGVRDALPDLQGHGTAVVIYQSEPRLPGDVDAYVLGVDPATFARFAHVTSEQRHDVSELHTVGAGRPIPAILVNAAGGADASSVSIRSTTLPLDVVARSAVFPGLRNGARPMVVVDRTALSHVDTNADRLNQVWTSDAQLDEAVLWIKAAGYNVLTEITSDVVIGTTGLLPVTWILGYLRALAILIGVVAIAGLVFALAARTRRRTVSYVLSRRMGMTKLTHLRSLLVELAIVVGFGWLLGSGAGAAAFGVIFRSLDVYPSLPPPAAYGLPAGTLVATAVVTAAVVVLASLATHALAERANPAEILRLE